MRVGIPVVLISLCVATSPAAAQDDVDSAKVDAAIRGGAAFLLKKHAKGFEPVAWNSTLELVMLTLSHAKAASDEEIFRKGLREIETCNLRYTYRVAMLAMALQRIDPVKYRDRIAHCAQWLVDTQLQRGEWGYPDTLTSLEEAPKPVEVDPPKPEKEEAGAGGKRVSIAIRRPPPKSLNLKARGDLSNTQFAVLGLKACADAGIEIPPATWESALRYFLQTQSQDGGWGYYFAGMKDRHSYASMTCAGVCGVAICKYGLGVPEPLRDKAIQAGLGWLGQNFRPEENAFAKKSHVADPQRWLYYYLYSIERVGRITGVEKLGRQKWYPAGANFLLAKQRPDGSWWTEVPAEQWTQAGDLETADTCFAILFLTKATPPLLPTVDPRKQ